MPSLHRLASWPETARPSRLRKVQVMVLAGAGRMLMQEDLMQEDEANMNACRGLNLAISECVSMKCFLLQDEPLAANSCTC